MHIGVFCRFLFRKFLLDEHWAASPFFVLNKVRVFALGFFVIFYFEKLSWTGVRPLCHFGFRKIYEYAHWGFLSFSIQKISFGRALARYAILGLEKSQSMCIGLFRNFLF